MGNNLAARARAANTPDTGTEVAQQKSPTLVGMIREMEPQFAAAMPRGAEATQLVRDAMTCLKQVPKLERCAPASVLGALMTCAQLGLRPGVLGHAWVLPYWDGGADRPGGGKGAFVAKLIIGYQGLVDLVYRTDRVTSIAARTVYENDTFELAYGAEIDTFVHRPSWRGTRGEPVAYYAVARVTNGGYTITDPVSHLEMEAYRDRHAPRTSKERGEKVTGPWVTEFEAMAHKTMVRRAMKLLPKSTEMAHALAHDDAVRLDYTPAGIDVPPAHIDGEVVDDDGGSPQDAQGGDQSVDDQITEETHDTLVEMLHGIGYTDTESRTAWAGRVVPGAKRVGDLTETQATELIASIQSGGNPGGDE